MDRCLMTHSLLSAWLYALKSNPYEDATTERDPMEEFMTVLRRELTPPTEAMMNGRQFEDLVTAIINGRADPNDQWYAAAEEPAAALEVRSSWWRRKTPRFPAFPSCSTVGWMSLKPV